MMYKHFKETGTAMALSLCANNMQNDFCDDCGKMSNILESGVCHKCSTQNICQEPQSLQSICQESNKEITEIPSTSQDCKTSSKEKSGDTAVSDDIKMTWKIQQEAIKKKNILEDVEEWAVHHILPGMENRFPGKRPLEFVGGIDISFVKGDDVNACAALVVLNFPEMEVVYEDLSMVKLTAPYIPGFLAFREAEFFVNKLEKLKKENSKFLPQVIMVDGNGILHPKRCGLATHLGVEADIPCFGVAKNLFLIEGLQKSKETRKEFDTLKKAGDSEELVTDEGEVVGAALRSSKKGVNPVFVSAGHKISLETCLWLTKICCRARVPEPTRWADIKSREYLRNHFLPPDPRQQKKGKTKKEKLKEEAAIEEANS